MTLINSSMAKHAFLQLDFEYPKSAFPSQTLRNIWTIGRKQVLRLQLHYFTCENLKRNVCYSATVQETVVLLSLGRVWTGLV